jgi:ABC-type uncharacterized transport system substrate-binding protein
MEVASRDDFTAGFEAAQNVGAQAIDVLASPFFNANRDGLIDLATRHRLPAMYESGEYVRGGGRISYGPDFADLFRRAAGYVDRLLKGAKPADLPIEQPTKFELLINAKTATALGVSFHRYFWHRPIRGRAARQPSSATCSTSASLPGELQAVRPGGRLGLTIILHRDPPCSCFLVGRRRPPDRRR